MRFTGISVGQKLCNDYIFMILPVKNLVVVYFSANIASKTITK